jgi:hypothetical protein
MRTDGVQPAHQQNHLLGLVIVDTEITFYMKKKLITETGNERGLAANEALLKTMGAGWQ